MKKIALSLVSVSALILPIVALAQIGGDPPTIGTDLTTIGQQIANAVWIVFTIIAVIAFVIAGILFVTSQGSPEKVATARQSFLWGIAGIVVAILAFVIITVVTNIF
ncbi:MAG: hypothetical protein ABIJ84_01655 [bacterium]